MHRPGPSRVLLAAVSLLVGLFVVAVGGASGVGRQPTPPSTAAPTGPSSTGGATSGSTAPAVPAPLGAKKMLVVGDSVIKGLEVYGALPTLQAALPGYDISFDAEESRSTVAGAGVIQAKNPAQFDTIVVSLGTNDAGSPAVFQSRVKTVLDELKAVPHVYWMTIHEKGRYATQYKASNAALSQVATFYPNTTVIDWNAFANTLPQTEFAADGLHLSGASAKAMATLIADSVKGTSQYAKASSPSTSAPAPPAPSSTGSAQAPATTDAAGQGNHKGSSSSNNGLIIGIIVAAVLVLGFLTAAIAGWRRSKSRRREERKARLDALFGSPAPAEPESGNEEETESGNGSRADDGTGTDDEPGGEGLGGEIRDAEPEDLEPEDPEPEGIEPEGTEAEDMRRSGADEVEASPEHEESSGA